MKVAFPHGAYAGSLLWDWQCHSSKLSLVSVLLQPRGVKKGPPTMTQLLPPPALCQPGPGQHMGSVMGLHPTQQSCAFPGAPCSVCASVTSIWPLLLLVCQLRSVHSGDYPRMTTSLSSPVQGLTWQPCVLPMSRGVWEHRARKDGGWQGQGSVELPPPLPRAMCWLRHSHAGSLQPL